MIEKTRLLELFDRYVHGEGTEKEYEELMYHIGSGHYEEWVKEGIGDLFEDGYPLIRMEPERARQIMAAVIVSGPTKKTAIRKAMVNRAGWWVAAASLILIAALFWLMKKDFTVNSNETVVRIGAATGTTALREFARLPDGSLVILNKNSTVTYGSGFNKNTREVMLSGEAYFDINADVTRPFIVRTGNISTTVLGTAFNIEAYSDSQRVVVTVVSGKVRVQNKKDVLAILVPNEQASVNSEHLIVTKAIVQPGAATEWKKGIMLFENMDFAEALAIVEDKFDVTFVMKDRFKNCRITASFLNDESLDEVLNVLSGVLNITYRKLPGKRIELDGQGCP